MNAQNIAAQATDLAKQDISQAASMAGVAVEAENVSLKEKFEADAAALKSNLGGARQKTCGSACMAAASAKEKGAEIAEKAKEVAASVLDSVAKKAAAFSEKLKK